MMKRGGSCRTFQSYLSPNRPLFFLRKTRTLEGVRRFSLSYWKFLPNKRPVTGCGRWNTLSASRLWWPMSGRGIQSIWGTTHSPGIGRPPDPRRQARGHRRYGARAFGVRSCILHRRRLRCADGAAFTYRISGCFVSRYRTGQCARAERRERKIQDLTPTAATAIPGIAPKIYTVPN